MIMCKEWLNTIEELNSKVGVVEDLVDEGLSELLLLEGAVRLYG